MLYGIGGTPEGVIRRRRSNASAAESRESSGRATTRSGRQLVGAGLDPDRVLRRTISSAGDDVFVAATGVTTGCAAARRPLPAERRDHGLDRHAFAVGHLAARSRRHHLLDKLEALTGREYR